MKEIYTLSLPETPLPVVFDSPHSGSTYPDDFNHACDPAALAHTEDRYVDELFACAPEYGAALLCANFPRNYVDVNRAIDDIDPNLLEDEESDVLGEINPSARSDAGIGLIRRLVRPGIPVYDRSLSAEEIAARIETYYKPYHGALEKLLNDAHYNFGQVWHINCHSMPSTSARPKQVIGLAGHKPRAVDFCLGDRDGTTCDITFTQNVRDFLRGFGYTVTVNDPFKGVELVERYSNPARGRHSLQLEINKALYMNETTHEKSRDFYEVKKHMRELVVFCADYAGSKLTDLAAD